MIVLERDSSDGLPCNAGGTFDDTDAIAGNTSAAPEPSFLRLVARAEFLVVCGFPDASPVREALAGLRRTGGRFDLLVLADATRNDILPLNLTHRHVVVFAPCDSELHVLIRDCMPQAAVRAVANNVPTIDWLSCELRLLPRCC